MSLVVAKKKKKKKNFKFICGELLWSHGSLQNSFCKGFKLAPKPLIIATREPVSNAMPPNSSKKGPYKLMLVPYHVYICDSCRTVLNFFLAQVSPSTILWHHTCRARSCYKLCLSKKKYDNFFLNFFKRACQVIGNFFLWPCTFSMSTIFS